MCASMYNAGVLKGTVCVVIRPGCDVRLCIVSVVVVESPVYGFSDSISHGATKCM